MHLLAQLLEVVRHVCDLRLALEGEFHWEFGESLVLADVPDAEELTFDLVVTLSKLRWVLLRGSTTNV